MTYTIRRMRESDIDNVYAIEIDVHIAPWSKSILKDCVLVGYHCLVLEIKDELGGYIICRHSERVCHILNFCIAKKIQSKGYGRKFLQFILDDLAQNKDMDNAILEVRPSNNIALHLYESMGFQQAEIKAGYYQDNGKVEDAILLRKVLRV